MNIFKDTPKRVGESIAESDIYSGMFICSFCRKARKESLRSKANPKKCKLCMGE